MHTTDICTLAIAKLRSRRILLSLTVATSGLLFGTLFAGSFILSGVSQSMEKFSDQSNHGRYLVKASPVIPASTMINNANITPDTIKELNALYKSYIERTKAVSKELNIPFDEKLIKSPLKQSPFFNPALPKDQQVLLDFESPVISDYQNILLERYAKNAKNTSEGLKKLANKYNARSILPTMQPQTDYTNTVYLDSQQEKLDYLLKNPEPHMSGASTYGFVINSVRNSSYQLLDDTLLSNWILSPNDKRDDKSALIPVVITTKEAVALFGKKLGIADPPTDAIRKIAWIKDLQKKINGLKYQACYRNSEDRLDTVNAINDLSDMKERSSEQSYVAPRVVYKLPTTACGSISVTKDNRTSSEKKLEQDRISTEKKLQIYTAPQRKLLDFQVVGVIDLNERSFEAPQNLNELTKNLFGNNFSNGALIPKNMYVQSGAKDKYDSTLFGEYSKGNESKDLYVKYGLVENIVVFNNLSAAKQFIKNEGCSDLSPECSKQFKLDPFGSNYLLLDDIQSTTRKILSTMLPIAIVIAGIILLFTMSRVIIDSRRETAVYRAMGARRVDIATIYMIYSLLVAILTILFSLAVGLVISLLVQALYGASFTAQARVAYGLFNSSTDFSFFSLNLPVVLTYLIIILGVAILATLLPLLRNVRRNPINDMREE